MVAVLRAATRVMFAGVACTLGNILHLFPPITNAPLALMTSTLRFNFWVVCSMIAAHGPTMKVYENSRDRSFEACANPKEN